jgi:hypothetical protein
MSAQVLQLLLIGLLAGICIGTMIGVWIGSAVARGHYAHHTLMQQKAATGVLNNGQTGPQAVPKQPRRIRYYDEPY